MKRHYIIGIILGIISLIIVFVFIHTDIFQVLELKFLDQRFRWRPQHKVNPNIVIVGIDDGSINTIGRWPWGRKTHAAVLCAFSKYPPKVIGFDLLFTEPEKEPRTGDIALAHYSRLLGNVVYPGYIGKEDNKKVLPISELLNASQVGYINVPPDKDGIIRKIPLIIRYNNSILPSFALQVLCTYLNINFKDIKVSYGRNISIPHYGDIPIDKNGFMWINYVGDQHVFKEVSFQQILTWPENEILMHELANSLLIIGITATGLGDQGHIPIATNVPLVSIHANVLNTILNKDFLIRVPGDINLFIVIVCVFLSTFTNVLTRPVRAGLLSLLLVISYIAINLWLFQKNIFIDIIGPVFGFITPFLLITIYRYGWEERQRRWIKKAFTHYLSKDVIDIILREPEKLQLGGELKTATVLYLDLRNFSAYCEGRSPKEVVGLLNKTFNWMTEIILRNGGMLDKYIGDAIMAIFGAPIEMPPQKQAEQAVLTSLEIIKKWNKIPVTTRCDMDIGIGINTGPMLIGNMGSQYIFNYTAVGDEVNIASRIQGLTSEYHVNIVITDSVYSFVKDKFKTEPLGEVTVRGRKGSVVIYKVIG